MGPGPSNAGTVVRQAHMLPVTRAEEPVAQGRLAHPDGDVRRSGIEVVDQPPTADEQPSTRPGADGSGTALDRIAI